MRFYTRMPKELVPYFDQELEDYKIHFKSGQLQRAWRHLERAHIIGQAYPFHQAMFNGKCSCSEFISKTPKK